MLLLTNTDFTKPNTVQEEKKKRKEKERKKGKRHLKLVRTMVIETATGYATLVIQVGPRDSINCQGTKRICVQRKKKRKEGKELGPRPRRYGGVSRGPHGKPSETSVGDIAPAGCRRQ